METRHGKEITVQLPLFVEALASPISDSWLDFSYDFASTEALWEAYCLSIGHRFYLRYRHPSSAFSAIGVVDDDRKLDSKSSQG